MRSTLSRAAATLVDSSEDHAEGALARWLDSRHRLKDNSETRILEFMTVAGFVNSRKREMLRVELSSLAIYDFLTTADLVKNRPSIHDEGCRLTVGSDDFHGAKENTSTSQRSEPPGQWNTSEIAAVGPKIKVKLNGESVSHLANPRRRPLKGHIGLQNHHPGSPVRVRNLFVKKMCAAVAAGRAR